MSKTIHVVDLPQLTDANDISPWFDILESIGFTTDSENKRAIWKDSGIFIKGYNSAGAYTFFTKTNGSTESLNAIVPTYDLSNTYKIAYIKFNEKSIAFRIIKPRDKSDYNLNAIFVEPDSGKTNWKAYTDGKMWCTGKNDSIDVLNMSSTKYSYWRLNNSMLLVPFVYFEELKSVYLPIYFPTMNEGLYLISVENKKYLISHSGGSYIPFAIDVDAIWDDEDY